MKRIMLGLVRWASRLPWLGERLVVLAGLIVAANRGGHDPLRNGEVELLRRAIHVHSAAERMTVFDVGANVGDWTALCLERAGESVDLHLFEPTQESFDALTRRFGGDRRIRLVRAALSDEAGITSMRAYGGTSTVNSLVDTQFHPGSPTLEEVSTLTGDSYCEAEGIDAIHLLKIDTEGFEWNVLAGFDRMLREQRIRIVQFEYGYIHATTGHLMRNFFQLMEGFGYRVGPVRPRGPEFRPLHHTDNDFNSGPNYVAALPSVAEAIANRRS